MTKSGKKLALFLCINAAFSICILGQESKPPAKPPADNSREAGRRANQETVNRANQEMLNRAQNDVRELRNRIDDVPVNDIPQPDKEDVKASKEARKQFNRTKGLLIAPRDYYEKYRDYLKDGDFVLARLHPENNCAGKIVVSPEDIERCADFIPVQGGGSMYSFISKTNYLSVAEMWRLIYGIIPPLMYESKSKLPASTISTSNTYHPANNWWNIHYSHNQLVVAENLIQGIIVSVGKRDLREVNLSSAEVRTLIEYDPGRTPAEAQRRSNILKQGISVGDLIYSSAAPAQVDATYIIRSIQYPYKPDRLNSKQETYTSKGMDITTVLKIIGREKDGSIVILWKELEKKSLKQKYKM